MKTSQLGKEGKLTTKLKKMKAEATFKSRTGMTGEVLEKEDTCNGEENEK